MKLSARILSLACVLFVCINLSGQSDFRKGFIINNNNDTVYGFINLKSNVQNSKICEYRGNENDKTSQLFSPEDIKAYRIVDNNKYYVSRKIIIDNVEELVFLEMLVDGIVDLYYYKALNKESYFIEKDTAIYELTNEERRVVNSRGVAYLVNTDTYKRILTVLFQDSPETINELKVTQLDIKPLVNVTKDYHNRVCKDYACIDYTKSTKMKIFIEPEISYNNAIMEIKTSEDKAIDEQFGFGINFRFVPIRWKNINVLAGINYSKGQFSDYFFNNLLSGPTRNFLIETDYAMLKIPILFEYSFINKRIKPFISIGYGNVFLLNPNHRIIEIKEYQDFDRTKETTLRKYNGEIMGGAGLRLDLNKKSYFQIKGYYEYRLPVLNLGELLDFYHVKSYMISVGYGFLLN